MSELTADDELYVRVVHRTAKARRMLLQQAGGERPQTPDLTHDQIRIHAAHLVMLGRVVVETWATCEGSVPQPLSLAVMDLKRALQAATASQEVDDA